MKQRLVSSWGDDLGAQEPGLWNRGNNKRRWTEHIFQDFGWDLAHIWRKAFGKLSQYRFRAAIIKLGFGLIIIFASKESQI